MNDILNEKDTLAKIETKTAPRVTPAMIEEKLAASDVKYVVSGTMTIFIITLPNGYNLVGESACVDPANFDEEIGRSIAYRNASQKLWPLEGYALAERMRGAPNEEYGFWRRARDAQVGRESPTCRLERQGAMD